jgi:hypothetical protein
VDLDPSILGKNDQEGSDNPAAINFDDLLISIGMRKQRQSVESPFTFPIGMEYRVLSISSSTDGSEQRGDDQCFFRLVFRDRTALVTQVSVLGLRS